MRTLSALILIALLAACGQAGDLYLPEEKPAAVAPAPTPVPVPEPETKEEPKKEAP